MAGNFHLWSRTAADNDDSDASVNWAEGQTPGSVNNSARAVMAALASFRDDINGSLSTAGSSNAYTIAAPNIDYLALSTGLVIGFKANHSNTAAATLNLNSLGAKAIRTQADVALVVGQIISGGHYLARYDTALNSGNGAWALLNPSPIAQPIGFIGDYAGTTAPSGWLFPYGQAISRTTYAAAFDVLGTTFGSGDGSTTFNLPDLRGRASFGKDDMGGSAASRITGVVTFNGTALGESGGSQSHTLSSTEMPTHLHSVSLTSGSSGTHTHGVSIVSDPGSAHTHSVAGTTGAESAGHTHSTTFNSVAAVSLSGGGAREVLLAAVDSHLEIITSDGASTTHTHDFAVTSGAEGAHQHAVVGTSAAGGDHTHSISGNTGSTGGGGAHNNMPPGIILNKIIYVGV